MLACKLQRSDALFACPLISFRISEADELNRFLVAEIDVVRSESPGLQRSNQNGWHSQLDFFSRMEPGFSSLRANMA